MILYFSGTGNSRYAAEYIAKRLGETDVRELDPSTLRDPSSAVISGGRPKGHLGLSHLFLGNSAGGCRSNEACDFQ